MTVLVHIAAAEEHGENTPLFKIYRMFNRQYRVSRTRAVDIALYLRYGEIRETLNVSRIKRRNGTYFQFEWGNNG